MLEQVRDELLDAVQHREGCVNPDLRGRSVMVVNQPAKSLDADKGPPSVVWRSHGRRVA